MTSIVADSLWGSTPINTFAMPHPPFVDLLGARGGHCYYELGSPLSHDPPAAPGGAARHERATPKPRWAAAKRADQPGAYPRLTRQPAPSNKQPRVAHKATHPSPVGSRQGAST